MGRHPSDGPDRRVRRFLLLLQMVRFLPFIALKSFCVAMTAAPFAEVVPLDGRRGGRAQWARPRRTRKMALGISRTGRRAQRSPGRTDAGRKRWVAAATAA